MVYRCSSSLRIDATSHFKAMGIPTLGNENGAAVALDSTVTNFLGNNGKLARKLC
jgi:hypothetical protein